MKPADVLPQMTVVQLGRQPVVRSDWLRDPRVVRLTGEVIRHGTALVPYHGVVDQVIRPGRDPKGNRAHPPIDISSYSPLPDWPVRLRAYADTLRNELSLIEHALANANALCLEVGA